MCVTGNLINYTGLDNLDIHLACIPDWKAPPCEFGLTYRYVMHDRLIVTLMQAQFKKKKKKDLYLSVLV